MIGRRMPAPYVAVDRRGGARSGRVLAVVAGAMVVVALGASAGDSGSLIGSKQITDDNIRSRDVRDGTLQIVDFASGAHAALRGPAGPQGAPGHRGRSTPDPPRGPTTTARDAPEHEFGRCRTERGTVVTCAVPRRSTTGGPHED